MSLPDSAMLMVDVRARRAERLLGAWALLAVAVTSALLSSLSPLLATLLFALAAVTIALELWRQGWLGGQRRLTAISWLPDGRWLLADGCDSSMPADLRADSRVGGQWLWLRWNAERPRRPRCRSLLLVGGDIPTPDLRRLVTRLRLAPQLAAGAEQPRRRQADANRPGA